MNEKEKGFGFLTLLMGEVNCLWVDEINLLKFS
jgi:hypothetical protein